MSCRDSVREMRAKFSRIKIQQTTMIASSAGLLSCLLVILYQATITEAFSAEECKNVTGINDQSRKEDGYARSEFRSITAHLKLCDSATGSIRGHYTSNYRACDFAFHKSSVDDRTDFSAATVCEDTNKVLSTSVQQYVSLWPDECVGDYSRCYSVDQDRAVYLKFFCDQGWDLPEGTTHISVNCLFDKDVSISDAQQNTDFSYLEGQREIIRRMEIVAFVLLGFMSLMCLLCCLFGHCWIVRPYVAAMRATATSEAEGLIAAEESPGIEAQVT